MKMMVCDGSRFEPETANITDGTMESDFMRRCALDHIEDELDVKAWHVAKAEHEANPVSYTLDEVEKTLSL